jgi:hypothetical protein
LAEIAPAVPEKHYLTKTLRPPDRIPVRRISILSKFGVTHYTVQRPIDYLIQVLKAEDQQAISKFVHRYGAAESYALGLLLVCLPEHPPQIDDFLKSASNKENGLLLYFAEIVEKIWKTDIIKDDTRTAGESQQDQLPQDIFKAVQGQLRVLLGRINQADVILEVKRDKSAV